MGMYDLDTSSEPRGLFADRPQMPYLLPFLAFMLIMLPGGIASPIPAAGGLTWEDAWFYGLPWVYTAKTILAAVLLWWFWRYYTPIRWSHLGLGAIVGLLGLVQWVGMEYGVQALWQWIMGDHTASYPRIFGGGGARIYNPVDQISNPLWRSAFYVIRIAGPTLVVPIMEELFWRDFLMRALVRGARFQEVAIGTFTWLSLLGMSLMFAAGHYQWPSGLVYGLMMGLLLIRTKSLGACIVAHAVTNFTLGIYVVARGDWQFW